MTYFIIFIFGICIGSFLNVVILRLGTGEGIVRQRSHCVRCGHILAWYDLIPVLSFFLLVGKCRYCGEKISWQYPTVELATGVLFVAVIFWILGPGNLFEILNLSLGFLIKLFFWFFVTACLIVVFAYDLRHYIILDKIVYPAIIITFLFRLFEIWNLPTRLASESVANWGFGNWQPFLTYLLVAVGAALFFLVIVLITRGKGMGIGDIKLVFLMGLILGWPQILVALFLAFLVGALVGVALILTKRKGWKSQVPFGPFLVLATFISLFFGSFLANWWFGLFS